MTTKITIEHETPAGLNAALKALVDKLEVSTVRNYDPETKEFWLVTKIIRDIGARGWVADD